MTTLRTILAEEGLLRKASVWEDMGRGELSITIGIGTYSFLQGEGVMFEPSRPFWGTLHPVEDYSITTMDEAKKWQQDHAAKYQNASVYRNPEETALRDAAQKVNSALAKMFRRKVHRLENIRAARAYIDLSVNLNIKVGPDTLEKNVANLGKRLGIKFQASKNRAQRSTPDPVEAEYISTALLDGLKLTLTQAYMNGNLFLVTVHIRS